VPLDGDNIDRKIEARVRRAAKQFRARAPDTTVPGDSNPATPLSDAKPKAAQTPKSPASRGAHLTAAGGRQCVAAELERRGARGVRVVKNGRKTELQAMSTDGSRTVTIRVKAKTRGNWQASTAEIDAPARIPGARFAVLVDRERGPSSQFFVMPDDWLKDHTREHYEWWLRIHGGHRPVSPNSTHVAIEPEAVQKWHDRWDVLGIF
jgi:hypothetical protein